MHAKGSRARRWVSIRLCDLEHADILPSYRVRCTSPISGAHGAAEDEDMRRLIVGLAVLVAAAAQSQTVVPEDWPLAPTYGVEPGEKFRFVFVPGFKLGGTLKTHNALLQTGMSGNTTHLTYLDKLHPSIKPYMAYFRHLGCTSGSDGYSAKSNTGTGTNRPVKAYWLGGPLIAGDYNELYGGDWRNESSVTDESGGASSVRTAGVGCTRKGNKFPGGMWGRRNSRPSTQPRPIRHRRLKSTNTNTTGTTTSNTSMGSRCRCSQTAATPTGYGQLATAARTGSTCPPQPTWATSSRTATWTKAAPSGCRGTPPICRSPLRSVRKTSRAHRFPFPSVPPMNAGTRF